MNVTENSKSDPARSAELLDRRRSVLLVVDVQEKLIPVISTATEVCASIQFLLDAAAVLQVPVVVSEQYPRGLGHSVSVVAKHAAVSEMFEKIQFSAAEGLRRCETFLAMEGEAGDHRQVVIVGIEAHICVLQTALDLISSGVQVFVVEDAVGSRRASDYENALGRITSAGGTVCVAESVVFEWCERAGSDEFKSISRLVRDRVL